VVQRVWDPLSSSQTHNLINNIRYVVNDFPTVAPQTKNLQDLKASLVKRFQESLAEDIFIPLMNKNQLEVTNTKSYHFYQRQFWTCMKLLGNILYCQGVLPDDILSQLVLDGLVNRQIILSLQNSPVDELTIRKTSTLLNQLPQQWLTTDNKSVESIKRYLYYLQDTLQRMLMTSTNEKIKKDTR
jgi:GC-rich sequence DNA-binding factor